MYEKSIRYDRETRDYAMRLDGELIGFARTYHEAEVTLDALVFELLNTPHALPAIVEEPAPEEDVRCPECGEIYCECDTPAEAPAESASTCCFCHKPHAAQKRPEMRAMLFAPLDVDFAPVGPEV